MLSIPVTALLLRTQVQLSERLLLSIGWSVWHHSSLGGLAVIILCCMCLACCIERPSKREVVRSLLSATDNETVEQDVERDYNKLARHPKGKFARYIYLLDEESSPSFGNNLWCVSMMFTRPAITPPEVNGFGWNLGTPSILSGAGPGIFWARSAQKRERESERKFCFFCPVNNARRYRYPVNQISRYLHTRRGSERWWILLENICENLPVRGLFPKRSTFARTSSTTSDFRPRYLRNDYKSLKVTTGWRAYWMLTFHVYRCNQLKVIPLACRLRTRNDIPGHRWLFRL